MGLMIRLMSSAAPVSKSTDLTLYKVSTQQFNYTTTSAVIWKQCEIH